jgi:hypothetical protein
VSEKTDQRNMLLEMGRKGEIQCKVKRLGRELGFPRGDVLEVSVRNGRWVLTHVPAGPKPKHEPAQHYFPAEE